MTERPLARIAALLFLVGGGDAQATADGPDYYRVENLVEGTTLTIRDAPAPDAARIGQIPANTGCVRNLGCRGGLGLEAFTTLAEDDRNRRMAESPRWCKVDFQGSIGWVEGRFLAEAACPSTLADPTEHRVETVRFPGTTAPAVIRGRLNGRQYRDYRVHLEAGQTLAVSMTASHRQTYFNVLPPGTDSAMFVGSLSGDRVRRMIPDDGDYTVRVYLMRAAARRNESSDYTVRIGKTGHPLPALSATDDALIAGTPFHAAATIPCAVDGRNKDRKTCEATVIRRGRDRTASVQIRWTDGTGERVRHILFVKGEPVGSDSPDSLRHVRRGDRTITRIGTGERFDIPDAFLGGG